MYNFSRICLKVVHRKKNMSTGLRFWLLIYAVFWLNELLYRANKLFHFLWAEKRTLNCATTAFLLRFFWPFEHESSSDKNNNIQLNSFTVNPTRSFYLFGIEIKLSYQRETSSAVSLLAQRSFNISAGLGWQVRHSWNSQTK